LLATRAVATPIAVGCSVVLKASELCPRTHFAIVEAFHEAGLSKGVLNSIQVDRASAAKVTECIISSDSIRKVEFIGSAAVGRTIGKLCGQYLKPVLMELGGKSPAIVLDDADIEKSMRMCADGGKLWKSVEDGLRLK
jgi:acyl-CoA reductase-like NAD-dependent aldehyde dehydrogenase